MGGRSETQLYLALRLVKVLEEGAANMGRLEDQSTREYHARIQQAATSLEAMLTKCLSPEDLEPELEEKKDA